MVLRNGHKDNAWFYSPSVLSTLLHQVCDGVRDCTDGTDETGCDGDDDCSYPAPVCDPTDQVCRCRGDADCRDPDLCSEAGQCAPRPCSEDADCNDPDLGQGEVSCDWWRVHRAEL